MITDFELQERGVDSSEPVWLYRFLVGDLKYTYTRNATDLTYLGDIYRSAGISHEGYSGGGSTSKSRIEVSMALPLEIPQMLLNGPPSEVIFLSVFRGQRGLSVYNLEWSGEVLGSQLTVAGAILQSANAMVSQGRNGLCVRWQRMCPYGVYEENSCQASRSFRAVNLLAGASRSGSSFTSAQLVAASLVAAGKVVAGYEDNWFTGGYVEYLDDETGILTKRTILAYNKLTGEVTLHPNMSGYAAGAAIAVRPGCKHTTLDCDIKHNNLPNCGADPFIPKVDIFADGESPW